MRTIDRIPIWFRRIITIGILLAIVGFVGVGIIAKLNTVDSPPGAKEAPWAIQTSSRVYYAKEMRLSGQTPEIRGYWTLEGKRYKYVEGEKIFEPKIWGQVKIIKRAVTK